MHKKYLSVLAMSFASLFLFTGCQAVNSLAEMVGLSKEEEIVAEMPVFTTPTDSTPIATESDAAPENEIFESESAFKKENPFEDFSTGAAYGLEVLQNHQLGESNIVIELSGKFSGRLNHTVYVDENVAFVGSLGADIFNLVLASGAKPSTATAGSFRASENSEMDCIVMPNENSISMNTVTDEYLQNFSAYLNSRSYSGGEILNVSKARLGERDFVLVQAKSNNIYSLQALTATDNYVVAFVYDFINTADAQNETAVFTKILESLKEI